MRTCYNACATGRLKVIAAAMCGRCASSRDREGVRHACAYRPAGSKKAVKPSWVQCSAQQYYPSYNISPQTNTPVMLSGQCPHILAHQQTITSPDVCDGVEERVLQTMKWGLIPSWHRGSPGSFGTVLNNCRCETMLEKPSFRNAVQKGQRCVVVVDGFFEWYRGKGHKQPYFIYFEDSSPTSEMMEVSAAATKTEEESQEGKKDDGGSVAGARNVWEHPTGRMLTMAGLFDIWKAEPDGDPLFTYTVITVDAHPTFAHIHDRMPAVLNGQEVVQSWLDPARTCREMMDLLQPTDCLHWHPVSAVVNNSRNHSPECVIPIDPSKQVSSQQNTLLNWFSKSGKKSALPEKSPLSKRPKLEPEQ